MGDKDRMKCYQCGSELTALDYCTNCGANVVIYKKVVKASNAYYNMGLEKANNRDMSGAILCLKASLKIDKNNIKARNLLGLVYFEIGEVVLALSQWVISKNIVEEKNPAGVYIKKVQSNPNKLDVLNHCVKKYNIALRYTHEENYDLAVIQLRKIIQANPKFVKAHLLLALLYIRNKEYEKAKKVLNGAIKVDKGNTLANKYLKEIEIAEYDEAHSTSDTFIPKKKKKEKEVESKPLSGNDVILPVSSYKEPSNGMINIVYVLMGVIIGAALIYYLIMPAKMKNVTVTYNETLNSYSSKIADVNAEVDLLKKEVDELTKERDEALEGVKNYQNKDDNQELYNAVIEAADNYMNDNITKAVEQLIGIDIATLPTTTAKNVYSMIMDKGLGTAIEELYKTGYDAYNDGDYKNAANNLEKVFKLDSSKAEAVFYCAKAYEQLSDNQKALEYYQYIIDNFSDLWYVNDAVAFVNKNS